jgi:hypothetical protein
MKWREAELILGIKGGSGSGRETLTEPKRRNDLSQFFLAKTLTGIYWPARIMM